MRIFNQNVCCFVGRVPVDSEVARRKARAHVRFEAGAGGVAIVERAGVEDKVGADEQFEQRVQHVG